MTRSRCRRPRLPGTAAVLGCALLAACAAGPSSPDLAATAAPPAASPATGGGLDVVANFYPVEFLARRVGGDAVRVTGLTPVGTEPHDLDVTARGLAALGTADVVLYVGDGFQPDVERAVDALPATTPAADLLDAPGVTLLAAPDDLGKESLDGGKDPHVWLDPVLMKAMAAEVATRFTAADPGGAAGYRARLATLVADLDRLDATLRADLADCPSTTVVTSHAAFGYLARRYGLTQIAIAGISPDAEPDARSLAGITRAAKAAGVRTVFFEEALPPRLAKTVADTIGARIDLLAALEFDPAEAIGARQDYLSVMQANGSRLRTGLGCR